MRRALPPSPCKNCGEPAKRKTKVKHYYEPHTVKDFHDYLLREQWYIAIPRCGGSKNPNFATTLKSIRRKQYLGKSIKELRKNYQIDLRIWKRENSLRWRLKMACIKAKHFIPMYFVCKKL